MVPASIPAAQPNPPTQELVGDAAADGRDENSQGVGGSAPLVLAAGPGPNGDDVTMQTAEPAGSVYDREPPSFEQAMQDQKRSRHKK